jgi:hypothetical protein
MYPDDLLAMFPVAHPIRSKSLSKPLTDSPSLFFRPARGKSEVSGTRRLLPTPQRTQCFGSHSVHGSGQLAGSIGRGRYCLESTFGVATENGMLREEVPSNDHGW